MTPAFFDPVGSVLQDAENYADPDLKAPSCLINSKRSNSFDDDTFVRHLHARS